MNVYCKLNGYLVNYRKIHARNVVYIPYTLYTLCNYTRASSIVFYTQWRIQGEIPGCHRSPLSVCSYMSLYTVDSRYSGPLKCGHLDIPAVWFGTECYLYVYCTKLTLKCGHSLFRIPANKQGFQCNFIRFYGRI